MTANVIQKGLLIGKQVRTVSGEVHLHLELKHRAAGGSRHFDEVMTGARSFFRHSAQSKTKQSEMAEYANYGNYQQPQAPLNPYAQQGPPGVPRPAQQQLHHGPPPQGYPPNPNPSPYAQQQPQQQQQQPQWNAPGSNYGPPVAHGIAIGQNTPPPYCTCPQPMQSVQRIVQKEGATKGQAFWACAVGGKDRGGCGFFQWLDANLQAESEAKRKKSSGGPKGENPAIIAMMQQMARIEQKLDQLLNAQTGMLNARPLSVGEALGEGDGRT